MSADVHDAEGEALKKRAEALKPKYPELSFRNLIEDSPPDTWFYINDVTISNDARHVVTPDVILFCENDKCRGMRNHQSAANIFMMSGWRDEFVTYTCRNCASNKARFALIFSLQTEPTKGVPGRAACIKLGQHPSFGPQTPARLISLIGPDRTAFLQGRRAENRGMGIGAFAYYRRVVENQKNRIIAEIAKVATLLGSNAKVDALFAAATAETRFSESIELVKDVIPQSLMIRGQNPLSLLHSALSRGLHDPEMTDERCLALAKSIRTILAELAERASEALKEDQEIQNALSLLMASTNDQQPKLARAKPATPDPVDAEVNIPKSD